MRLQFGTVDTTSPGIVPAGGEPGRAGRSTVANSGAATGDRITLSPVSSLIGRHEATRSARIQELAQLVQSGSYQISGQAVSSRIVASSFGS